MFGRIDGTRLDLLVVASQAWSIICCGELSRTVCTALAEYKLGGSSWRLLRFLFCDNFDSYSSPCFWSATLCITSLKICLIISFVMSSQSLMCSALIPLLSQAFPLLSLLIADCISSAGISGISFLSHSLYCSPSLLDLAAEFIEFGGFRNLHRVCCRIHRLRWEFHFSM